MGHYWLGWNLRDSVGTLPESLRDAGYETHVSGIQHLGPDPHALGYDHVGTDASGAKRVADAVESFISGRDEEGTPFFVSAGFSEPHRLGSDEGRGFDASRYDSSDPASVDVPSYLPDVPVIREELAGLEGMVEYADEAIGSILGTLDEENLREDTLVIFTTDHGVAMPRAKGMCYDPGLETAFVAHYPGVFDGGRELDALLSNVDLMPTLLDLIGVDPPHEPDGRSFLSLVASGEYNQRDRIFAEMTYHDKYNPVRAVRTDRYKYVQNFDDLPEVYLPLDILQGPSGRELFERYYSDPRPEEELYDLKADPDEQTNLIDDAEYADVADRLRNEVDDWMTATDDPLLDGDVPVPKEHVEKLRTYPW
jgi:arylsulfatase A-like enzyme